MHIDRLIAVVGVVITLVGGLQLYMLNRNWGLAKDVESIRTDISAIQEWKRNESDFRKYITDDLRDDLRRSSADVAALRDLVGRSCARP